MRETPQHLNEEKGLTLENILNYILVQILLIYTFPFYISMILLKRIL